MADQPPLRRPEGSPWGPSVLSVICVTRLCDCLMVTQITLGWSRVTARWGWTPDPRRARQIGDGDGDGPGDRRFRALLCLVCKLEGHWGPVTRVGSVLMVASWYSVEAQPPRSTSPPGPRRRD
jgi:hypothetical protein